MSWHAKLGFFAKMSAKLSGFLVVLRLRKHRSPQYPLLYCTMQGQTTLMIEVLAALSHRKTITILIGANPAALPESLARVLGLLLGAKRRNKISALAKMLMMLLNLQSLKVLTSPIICIRVLRCLHL